MSTKAKGVLAGAAIVIVLAIVAAKRSRGGDPVETQAPAAAPQPGDKPAVRADLAPESTDIEARFRALDGSPAARAPFLRSLAALTDEEAWRFLRPRWEGIREPADRLALVDVFVAAGGRRAINVLHLALADPATATEATRHLRSIAFLEPRADDPAYASWFERFAGLSVAQARDLAARGFLAGFIAASPDDKTALLRFARSLAPAAIDSLRAAGLLEALPLCFASGSSDLQLEALALVSTCKPGLPWLTQNVAPLLTDPALRAAVTGILLDTKLPEIAPIFASHLNSSDPDLVAGAAEALGRTGNENYISHLVHALRGAPTEACRESIARLGLAPLTGIADAASHDAEWWEAWMRVNRRADSVPALENR